MAEYERKIEDIASESFITTWPHWLRWALFFPTAILGSVVASVLYLLINTLGGFMFGISNEGFFFQMVSTAILGAVFVYGGAWMAPRYQLVIAIGLLVVLTIVATILFLFSFTPEATTGPILYGLHCLVLLIAGGAVVFHLKSR